MKTALTLIAAVTFSGSLFAMDISPYKVGEKLNAEQAKEMEKRFKERQVQDWQVPKAADIDKEPNAKKFVTHSAA